MSRFRLIPDNPRVDFVGRRRLAFTLSLLLLLAAVVSLGVRGLNLGIDFQGGVLLEVRAERPFSLAELRAELSGLGLGEVALQEFGTARDLLIRVQRQPGGGRAQVQAVETVRAALGNRFEVRRTEVIGPKVSAELLRNAYIAAALAVLAMGIYVALRFEWQFAIGALVATGHDVLALFGLFSFVGLEFNLTSVAAILLIAGYSINDTIVIYDRLRENLRRYRSAGLAELINVSTNQTLARTVLTSGTTLLAILPLLLSGGPTLFGLSLAMTVGILVGTFSSVYVAAALLLYLPALPGPEPAAPRAPEGVPVNEVWPPTRLPSGR